LELEADGSDAWKVDRAVSYLSKGGVGVVPTESSYAFVTPVESREGVERILRIKGMESCKKPLSLLCADLSTIERYTYGIDKQSFKVLKRNLPGPFTFILEASSDLPKMFFKDVKGGKKSAKRKTVGCRLSADPVASEVLSLLEGQPLLVSTVPAPHPSDDGDEWEADLGQEGGALEAWGDGSEGFEEYVEDADSRRDSTSVEPSARWFNDVDFVLNCGPRPSGGSTIFDLTNGDGPALVRSGVGGSELR